MSIEQVTRFQTKDGTLHNSDADAKGHITDQVCEHIDDLITELFKKELVRPTHKQQIFFVNGLVGDYNKIKKLKEFLEKYVD